MGKEHDFLKNALAAREAEGNLRQLNTQFPKIDFASNDYLGLAKEFKSLLEESGGLNSGLELFNDRVGSRLLTGNSTFVTSLEHEIAAFHRAESGVLFTSGYLANMGLLSAVGTRGSMILYDAEVHASIRDGIRLSDAKAWAFRNNDMAHLEERLKRTQAQRIPGKPVFVVTESLFSMSGRYADLQAVSALCKKYNALLIVDEAHAVGICGESGRGLVCERGLEAGVFARVVTFGKALGCQGAIVLGSAQLKEYLVNFSRPFIYTTAPAFLGLNQLKWGYDKMSQSNYKKLVISNLSNLFDELIKGFETYHSKGKMSHIKCIHVGGNARTKAVAAAIQKEGYDVRPILHPTVPKATERLRIILHAFNTEAEVKGLITSLKKAMQ